MKNLIILTALIVLFTVTAQAQTLPAGYSSGVSPYSSYYGYPQSGLGTSPYTSYGGSSQYGSSYYGYPQSGLGTSPYTSYSGAYNTPSSTGTGYAASNIGWSDPEAIERPKAKSPNTYLCDKISKVKITGSVPELVEANTQITITGTVNKFSTTCDGMAYQCRGTKVLQCTQSNTLLKIELKAPNCPASHPKILETHGEKSVMNWVMLMALMQMMSSASSGGTSGASGGTTAPGGSGSSAASPGGGGSGAGAGTGGKALGGGSPSTGGKSPSGGGDAGGGCPDGKCPKTDQQNADAGSTRGSGSQVTKVDGNNNPSEYSDEQFDADVKAEKANVGTELQNSEVEGLYGGEILQTPSGLKYEAQNLNTGELTLEQQESSYTLRSGVSDSGLTMSDEFSQPVEQPTNSGVPDTPTGPATFVGMTITSPSDSEAGSGSSMEAGSGNSREAGSGTAHVVARSLPITGFLTATGMATSSSSSAGAGMFLLAALLQEQVNPQDCYRVCGKEYWTDIQNACVPKPTCDGSSDKVIKQNDCAYGCKEVECGAFENADIQITVKSDKGIVANTYETKTDSKGRYSFTFKTPNADGQYAVIVTVVKNWDSGIEAPSATTNSSLILKNA